MERVSGEINYYESEVINILKNDVEIGFREFGSFSDNRGVRYYQDIKYHKVKDLLNKKMEEKRIIKDKVEIIDNSIIKITIFLPDKLDGKELIFKKGD